MYDAGAAKAYYDAPPLVFKAHTPQQVYDAGAAKAYYDAHTLEYVARLAFIASSASSFGAALAVDYLTGMFLQYFTEMCSGSEAGSYLRLTNFCITQL